MAPSKKKKEAKSLYSAATKRVVQRENPDSILSEHPTWSFSAYDSSGRWAFTKERLRDMFWEDILPKLRSFERMTWSELLVKGNKQHHSIPVTALNKAAVDRLRELKIDEEKLISLRLTGTLRIYGFLSRSTLVILWVDADHGDNDSCVCRSKLKNT